MALNADSKWLASVDERGCLRLWELGTGILIRRVYDPPHRLWEAANGEELERFLGERIGVMGAVSFLPDGEALAAVTEDGRLFSWNMATGREVRRSKLDRLDRVGVVAFAPDARTIAATWADGLACGLWRAETGNLVCRVETNDRSAVRALASSTDGRPIASSDNDGIVRLWDVAGLRILRQAKASGEPIQCLAFSPIDGSVALGGDDGILRLWRPDLGTLERPPLVDGDGGPIWCVTFSRDGQRVAWGGEDQVMRIWERKRRAISRYHGHQDGITQILFGKDSRLVCSASSDGTILVWDIPEGGKSQDMREKERE